MATQMTILLADDDRVQTLMLTARLRAEGFKVVVAYDGNETFTAAIRNQPDAIVLDLQMPGGTGHVVLKRLKASSKTSQIPVIVVSGSEDPNVIPAVKGLGADEYLPKPVNFEQLHAALVRVLGLTPKAPSPDGAA